VRLSAIVVAFGKEALLEACLSSLEGALANVDGPAELVVVVNDLRASARERLLAREPAAVIVDGSRELGFAGGVAAALEVARGEWIALVNDDCTLDPHALRELLDAGDRHPEVGSVAAQVRFAGDEGTINSAGIEVDELGVARERSVGEPVAAVDPQVVEVFGASASLGLYRRAMLDAIGGFDTSFFAYLEDADVAWRARMAGWRCVLAPRAIAVHRHSSTLGHSSGAKHLRVGRNRVRMLAKNASGRLLRRRLLGIVAYDALYVAYAVVADRTPAPLVGRVQGLRDWRSYRRAGCDLRRELELSPSPGARDALRRNRVYRSAFPTGAR
jgi:GT2 family glycosyltransferase